MIGRSALMARSFLKPNVARNQLVRKSHDDGGVPGANLPFQIRCIYRFTAVMTAYLASGIAIPFLILRHQLKKH